MSKSKKNFSPPSKEEVIQFEMLYPLILSVLNEIRELSKKKQDGVLNPLKVKSINKLLEKIKALLLKEPYSDFLDLLDEVMLPSNSDAVIMIVQFVTSLEQFKKKYYENSAEEWGLTSQKYVWKTRN